MHRLCNALATMVCLWVVLACGADSNGRLVRCYAGCLADTNATLHRLTASSASGTVALSAEAVEERLRGQLESGGRSPWGRSGPTTPATANRSRRELREERG